MGLINIDAELVNADWLKRLRTLGGPGSGNFGHAGRPGEVGGSASRGTATMPAGEELELTQTFSGTVTPAKFREVLEARGYTVIERDDLPQGLVESSAKEGATIDPKVSNLDEHVMNGVVQGIDDIEREFPEIGRVLKERAKILLADTHEMSILATAVNGPTGMYLIVNSSPIVQRQAMQRPPEPYFIGHEFALKATEKKDFAKEIYRQTVIHEVGHIADFATASGLSRIMVSTLMNTLPEPYDTTFPAYMKKHLSQYAHDGGPYEAAAEVFAATVNKRSLPSELHKLRDEIVRFGKKAA